MLLTCTVASPDRAHTHSPPRPHTHSYYFFCRLMSFLFDYPVKENSSWAETVGLGISLLYREAPRGSQEMFVIGEQK